MDERRLRIATLAIGALLLAAFAAAGFVLDLRPAANLRAHSARLHGSLEAQARVLGERPRLEADIAALESARIAGGLKLPAEPRLDEFVAQAGDEARRHRVRIVELQPGEVHADSSLGVLPVRVTTEGDFERIYAWMVALESTPRLVRVESLQAHALPGSDVRAELQLVLYMGRGAAAGKR